MKISYYAVFQYDFDGISISFPDVPSALTCADNEADGLKYAIEALELTLYGMSPDELPLPSSADQIILEGDQKIFLITIEMEIKEGTLFCPNVTEVE